MALVITANKKSRYKDNTNLLDLIYCERFAWVTLAWAMDKMKTAFYLKKTSKLGANT